jgi:hypothetical protein
VSTGNVGGRAEANVDDLSIDLDLSKPNVARMYDYYLGGSTNFAADRAAAEQVLRVNPDAPRVAKANRAFVGRVVRYLVQQGIDQFLDLGSGIPTVGNVHEIAQRHLPHARVAYVDIESVAVIHARKLLAGNEFATVSQADIRRPHEVLAAPGVAGLLDFSRPVAVIAMASLQFVSNADDPAAIVAAYRDACVSGSYLGISHLSAVTLTPEQGERLKEIYRAAATPSHHGVRSREEIAALISGYELVEPGLVLAGDWRSDQAVRDDEGARLSFYGCLGRLP